MLVELTGIFKIEVDHSGKMGRWEAAQAFALAERAERPSVEFYAKASENMNHPTAAAILRGFMQQLDFLENWKVDATRRLNNPDMDR